MRIYDLKRSQVSRMLDDIADEAGPVQADRVLSYIFKKASTGLKSTVTMQRWFAPLYS